MEEKQDNTLVESHANLPPRGKLLSELSPSLIEHEKPSSHRTSVLTKKKYQTDFMEGPAYFYKEHTESRLAELEAYNAAICQFLATSEYVPNTRAYFDSEGCPVGIASKAISDFRSNYEEPLQLSDLLLNNLGIEAEFKQRTAKLITQELVMYYEDYFRTGERLKRYASGNINLLSWFSKDPTEHSTQALLLKFIEHSQQYPLDALLNDLSKRSDYLKNVLGQKAEIKSELFLLDQVIHDLTAFNQRGSIENPVELSIELYEKLDKKVKENGIDLELCEAPVTAEVDGVSYTVAVQDLINYRTIRGQAVSLTTQFIHEEGDNNNSNRSRKGQFFDFEWTRTKASFYFKHQSLFNKFLRNPQRANFACTQDNIEHFPNIRGSNLFYWPTKKIDLKEVLRNSIIELFFHLEKELVESDELFRAIPAQYILWAFDTVDRFNNLHGVNKPAISNTAIIYLYLNIMLGSQARDEAIAKEKIRYLLTTMKEKMMQIVEQLYHDDELVDISEKAAVFEEKTHLLFKHGYELQTILEDLRKTNLLNIDNTFLDILFALSKRLFTFIETEFAHLSTKVQESCDNWKRNAYTIADNTHYKLLAGHPVFDFHKYKTFLKYLLTDPIVYQILAELNIAKIDNVFHDILIEDDMRRFEEVNAIIAMPGFKYFLKKHGAFAFELIKEEFVAVREKYSKKTEHQSYYQRMVHALDIEVIEEKFNVLFTECTMFEEELQENDESVLCI